MYFVDNYSKISYTREEEGKPGLRKAQLGAVHAIAAHYSISHQSGASVVIMPTGSGKTFTTITWLMESAIPAGYRVIWFAHRQELVDQATREFCNVAPILAEHGIKKVKILPISGQHAGMSQSCGYDINVCSIHSVATKNGRRFIRRMLGTPGAKKVVVIIDEAHHAPMKSYQDVLDTIRGINPSMILLGLTATPKRLEGNHLLMEMFNVEQNRKKRGNGFIYEVSLQHLIQYEYLATPHYIRVNTEIHGDTAYHLTKKSVELFQQFAELHSEFLRSAGVVHYSFADCYCARHFKYHAIAFLCFDHIVGDGRRYAVYKSVSGILAFFFDLFKGAVIVVCFDDSLFSRNLSDVMKEVDETFSERLIRLANERNLKNAEIYKRANIRRQLFSKIISHKEYQPKKETAIVLALALHLNLDETKDFLSRAGYALPRSSQRDLVIKFFIENEYYDVLDIDQALYDHGLEPLSN